MKCNVCKTRKAAWVVKYDDNGYPSFYPLVTAQSGKHGHGIMWDTCKDKTIEAASNEFPRGEFGNEETRVSNSSLPDQEELYARWMDSL